MSHSLLIVVVLFLSGTFSLPAGAAPSHIIILRHGEKTSDAERYLSPRGYERAEALVRVFAGSEFQAVYGMPVVFFAASGGKSSSLRSVETVTPSAKALAVDLDTSYEKDDGEKLMKSILQDRRFNNRTVVICWNHSGIADLIRPLDGEFPKKWGSKIFDRFWVLDRQTDGSWSFLSIPQGLLPGDSEL